VFSCLPFSFPPFDVPPSPLPSPSSSAPKPHPFRAPPSALHAHLRVPVRRVKRRCIDRRERTRTVRGGEETNRKDNRTERRIVPDSGRERGRKTDLSRCMLTSRYCLTFIPVCLAVWLCVCLPCGKEKKEHTLSVSLSCLSGRVLGRQTGVGAPFQSCRFTFPFLFSFLPSFLQALNQEARMDLFLSFVTGHDDCLLRW